MALPTWPAGLRYKPLRDGWSINEPFRPPLESEMQGGNIRSRPVYSDIIAQMPEVFQFSREEYATFKAFVQDDLNYGSSEFTKLVWDGTDYVEKTCRIRGGTYTVQPSGLGYRVSYVLDVRDL